MTDDYEDEFSSREYAISDDNESEDAWWGYLQKNHKLSLQGRTHFLYIEPLFSQEYPAALSRRLFSISETDVWALLDRYLSKHKVWQLKAAMDCIVNYAVTLHYHSVHSSYTSEFGQHDLEKVKFEFVPNHRRVVNAIAGWLQVRRWELELELDNDEPEENEEQSRPLTTKSDVGSEVVFQAPPTARPHPNIGFLELCKLPFTPEQVDEVLLAAGIIDANNDFLARSKGKAALPAAYRILVAKQKMHNQTNSVWSKLFAERYNVKISTATAKFNLASPHATEVFKQYCATIEGIIDGMDTLDSVVSNLIPKIL